MGTMQNLQQGRGAIRLFRVFGINVFLHWSWFLVLFIAGTREFGFTSRSWNIVAYLVLFAIVLIHEFGHALACRSVGGTSSEIILWPFGGIAFAQAPRRPGATLWTIAAGPLVNVVLVPILWLVMLACDHSLAPGGYAHDEFSANAVRLVHLIFQINVVLLIFNILPVFPLDGGQILQSLLWFKVGEVRSVLYASFIGLIGCAILLCLAVLMKGFWLGLIVLFLASQCWPAFRWARAMQEQIRKHGQQSPPFSDDRQ